MRLKISHCNKLTRCHGVHFDARPQAHTYVRYLTYRVDSAVHTRCRLGGDLMERFAQRAPIATSPPRATVASTSIFFVSDAHERSLGYARCASAAALRCCREVRNTSYQEY